MKRVDVVQFLARPVHFNPFDYHFPVILLRNKIKLEMKQCVYLYIFEPISYSQHNEHAAKLLEDCVFQPSRCRTDWYGVNASVFQRDRFVAIIYHYNQLLLQLIISTNWMALHTIRKKSHAGAELHEERVQFQPKCDFFLNCMEKTFS